MVWAGGGRVTVFARVLAERRSLGVVKQVHVAVQSGGVGAVCQLPGCVAKLHMSTRERRHDDQPTDCVDGASGKHAKSQQSMHDVHGGEGRGSRVQQRTGWRVRVWEALRAAIRAATC